MRYGPHYEERIRLRDGLEVLLRPIGPEDKKHLQRGLSSMTPHSRYMRFFTEKPRFSAGELAYLTELDGWNHFALGALRTDGQRPEGVGVGRFVRLPEAPTVAEPAVAVVDAVQRRGLGRELMRRLVEAARERGIEVFRSEFLAQNLGAQQLVEALAVPTGIHRDGPYVTCEIRLQDAAQPEAASALPHSLYELLRLAGQQWVQIRRRFSLLGPGENGAGTANGTPGSSPPA